MITRCSHGSRWILLVAAALLAVTGCVRRTVTISTAPQGATVFLNDDEVGTSPLTVPFTWYGDYDVIVRKDGYETLITHHKLKAPWYEVPPIDFISEILVPVTITDARHMHFDLEERRPVDRDKLVKDAVEFRERTLFGSE